MVEIIRKKKESTLSLLKKFNRKIKQSGNLARFKNNQFKKRKVSDLIKKKTALARIKRAEEIKKLYKLGKYEKKHTK